MALIPMQVSYFPAEDVNGVKAQQFASGTEGGPIPKKPIYKLGIQGYPGLKVLIDDRPIILGETGIYELDMGSWSTNQVSINKIQFESSQLQTLKDLKTGYIIVDFLYQN